MVTLPPPAVVTKGRPPVVFVMAKLMVCTAVLLFVIPPASTIGLPTKVKLLAPLLKVMPAKFVPFPILLVSVVPDDPAAPKNSQSPPIGGALTAGLQLAAVAQFLSVLPSQVSLPFAATAGVADSARRQAIANCTGDCLIQVNIFIIRGGLLVFMTGLMRGLIFYWLRLVLLVALDTAPL